MPKKKQKWTTETCFVEFMEAVRQTEEAETDKDFEEAFETAVEVYQFIEDNEDEFSSAELRRTRRAMEHLQSLEEMR